jgi:shikimate kinase
MKIFVFAVQCGGKTTLAKYLRNLTDHEVVEMDDEIVQLNGGSWPRDMQHKITNLEPIVYSDISAKHDVIFIDSHLATERAIKLKGSNFKILYVELSRGELTQRNKHRFESGSQDDAIQWIDMELKNAEELHDKGLFDYAINGEQPTEKIAKELLGYISKSAK